MRINHARPGRWYFPQLAIGAPCWHLLAMPCVICYAMPDTICHGTQDPEGPFYRPGSVMDPGQMLFAEIMDTK